MCHLPPRFRSIALTLLTVSAMLVTFATDVRGQSSTSQEEPTPSRYTEADVSCRQYMIGHHAQALDMVSLVAARSAQLEIESLAERILVSQKDEIGIMKRWLAARGEASAKKHDMHSSHEEMPGMLSPVQMDSLRASSGDAFNRLFLQYMIQHHEGALVMVAELLRSPGAAQDPMVFQIVSDIDADQRAEIRRMQALLARLP